MVNLYNFKLIQKYTNYIILEKLNKDLKPKITIIEKIRLKKYS
jgi:hypothetical protein